MTSLISIILANHNQAPTLAPAIDSVLAQTYGEIELIVVDAASDDDSRDIIAQYGDRIQQRIYLDEDDLVAATNAGIAKAQGDWVALLDARDRWLPDKLAQQAIYLGAYPTHSFVYCNAFEYQPFLGLTGTTLFDKNAPYTQQSQLSLFLNPYVPRSTLLVRRTALIALDTPLHTVLDGRLGESAGYELHLRLAAIAPFGFIDRPLVFCKQNADADTFFQGALDRFAARRKVYQYTPSLQRLPNKQIREMLYGSLRTQARYLLHHATGEQMHEALRTMAQLHGLPTYEAMSAFVGLVGPILTWPLRRYLAYRKAKYIATQPDFMQVAAWNEPYLTQPDRGT